MRISKHAIYRFRTRGRLLLHSEETRSVSRSIYTIERMIREGYADMSFHNCPFYRTKTGISKIIVNGRFKFYIKNNTVVTCVVTQLGKEHNWRY